MKISVFLRPKPAVATGHKMRVAYAVVSGTPDGSMLGIFPTEYRAQMFRDTWNEGESSRTKAYVAEVVGDPE